MVPLALSNGFTPEARIGACRTGCYPARMMLRLFVLATMAFLWLTGARRRRLEDGDVSLVYYRIEGGRGGGGWLRLGRWGLGREGRDRQRHPSAGGGPAEPWILLHGLGSVAATWGQVLTALRLDCQLIVPELSALGGTRAPGGALTFGRGIGLLARLIEQEMPGGPVTVVGLSMGAWMAVRLALARPDLVARLVLIDAAGYRHQDWDRINRLVRVHDLAGVDLLYSSLFATTPWLMRWSRGSFLAAYSSPVVCHLLDALGEPDTYRQSDLARLTMPVGLIWGEHDGLFTLDVAREMAAALPHSRLYVLPDCGHAVHLECPGALVAALARLRRELPLSISPA
jgi:3-oxoadipate enol-lactonase